MPTTEDRFLHATSIPAAVEPANRIKNPNLILAICCMSVLIFSMDATIVNVALPAIQKDLHARLAGLQWILDAYTLVVASFLMLAGSMSDRFGRRRVFLIGLAVFTLASLLCSQARTIEQLILHRALQGGWGVDAEPGGAVDYCECVSGAEGAGACGWYLGRGDRRLAGDWAADRRGVDGNDGMAVDLLDQCAGGNCGGVVGSVVCAGVEGGARAEVRSGGTDAGADRADNADVGCH